MDDIFNTLNGIIPPKYLAPLTALFVISQVIGRGLQAIRAGGGLRSIILGIWFGTNTKTEKQEVAKDEPTNNKLGLLLLVLLCGFMSFGLLTLGAGCGTPPQRIAYNSLYSVQTVTVGAYDGYVAEVIAGRIRTNDLPRVAKKFDLFQAAFRVALDGVQFNTNALAPDSLMVISGDLINLINAVTPKTK